MIFEVLLGVILLAIVWVLFLRGFILYLRCVYAFGYKDVGYIFIPFTRFKAFQEQHCRRYGNSYEAFAKIIKKNPDTKLIIYHTFMINFTLFTSVDLIKEVTMDKIHHIQKPLRFMFEEEFILGIFFLEGQNWKISRQLLSNLFHFDSLKIREAITAESVLRHTQNLQENKLNAFQVSRKIISDGLVDSLLGKRFSGIQYQKHTFYQEIAHIVDSGVDLARQTFYLFRKDLLGLMIDKNSYYHTKKQKVWYARLLAFKKVVYSYLDQEKLRFTNGEEVAPFLSAFFKSKIYTDLNNQIFMQIFNFFFAGVDSTATALTLCFYRLAQHSEIQKELREQIKEHIKNNRDIHSHKNLNNFIKQTLRMNTPVPTLLTRRVVDKLVLGEKLTLHKNEWTVAAISLAMRNPKHFQEPDKFNPDRFDKPLDNIFSHIPFSAGPRNCIGQHLAMIILRISIKEVILKYELTRTETQFKMLAGGFLFNRPLDNDLVRFDLIK